MSTALITSRTAPSRPAPELRGASLWQLGFRPFFLLASGFAVLSSTFILFTLRYLPVLTRQRLDGKPG